ncbi:angiogenic factor with G patch and FHA domains 1 isoform X4 [Haematobia irritans]|uniref:angiogenic factor with G patch and FHA domains 1 isoform X4 n=1 Tax=Haematobia irritans TaxID=7368 RepID=UPI003F4F9006
MLSNSDSENTENEDKSSKSKKFYPKKMDKVKEMQVEHLHEYIESLHCLIKQYEKKLKKYKDKIRKLKQNEDNDDALSNHSRSQAETQSNSKDNQETNEANGFSAVDAFSFVNEMRQAAQEAQNISNFVYEPTSGLYYDKKSGYYYNAEYGLYYDGNTGCYYSYNQEKNCYEFHSQVQVQASSKTTNDSTRDDCLETNVNSSLLNRFSNLYIDRMRRNALDIAKKYPPSLRIVVQESNLEGLKVGSLSLITYKGGSLGREGSHDVIIPDVNVSKFHLKFTYDTKRGLYKCVDLGSRNGTILNGIRMSGSKTESEAHDLVHGSVIQIGQTKLLCHVHEGNSTCGLCEPGLLIETTREITPGPTLSHKQQLKKLQKKYGLKNEKFIDNQQNPTASGSSYQDRAASRRLEVGSSSDKEKTQVASVDTAISSENKGFKMLSKLGWSKGESLGKTQSGGLLEPINVESNVGTKGLGCDDPAASVTIAPSVKRKMDLMQKTKERYEKADIFAISDDSN